MKTKSKKVKADKYKVNRYKFIGGENEYTYEITFNKSLQRTDVIFTGIPEGIDRYIRKQTKRDVWQYLRLFFKNIKYLF